MLQKVKNVILAAMTLTVGTTSLLGLAVSTAVPAYADIQSNLCQGVNTAANGTSSTDCTAGGSNFNLSTIATSIVNIFSWIVGVVAVIMIIVGGFRYITSGGSSEKISSAKNTLIYAIIGLIIVALAQFIVHYVVNTAANGTLSNTTG